MTDQRLDIAYRVITGSNDTFTVDHDGDGAKTCTVTAGLYMTSSDLAGAVQDAIDAQWPAVSFEAFANADGTVTIDSTDQSFDLDWTGNHSLRDWLGYSGNLSGSRFYTGSAQPGVLISSMPWVDELHGWAWGVHGIDHESTGQQYKVSRRDLWRVTLFEKYENLSQLRSVLYHLMRGTPATWHRSTSGSQRFSTWSYDAYFGRLQVCADPQLATYSETTENPDNLQTVLTVRLNLVAI